MLLIQNGFITINIITNPKLLIGPHTLNEEPSITKQKNKQSELPLKISFMILFNINI